MPGTAFDSSTYDRIIELYDFDGSSLISTLSQISSDIDLVPNAEFEWLRQGGCGTGSFTLDMEYGDVEMPEVGQWIVCSYANNEKWYKGRIEEVTRASPSGVTVRTFGLWAILTEIQVGGQAWWDDTSPRTFGRYNYFVNDPDFSGQLYTNIQSMKALIETLYQDYIATWGNGSTIQLDTIDVNDTTNSFTSMTFRGGESLSQIIRSLAEPYNSSYGIGPDDKFFFIPPAPSAAISFQDGVDCNLSSSEDRSLLYNRLIIHGGYVYGVPTTPGFYMWQYHAEDADSVAAYGVAKTLSIYLPWIRNHLDSINFSDGFFAKYAQATTRHTVETIAQGGTFFPWQSLVDLADVDGVGIGATSHSVDTVRVSFNEAPRFAFTTGPDEPKYPKADNIPTSGEQFQADGGGGGGGDAQNVSGFTSFVTDGGSIDSCYWQPCNPMTVGFYVTSAFPVSGYVVGDVYYMSKPICPRTNITFWDMETPIGTKVTLNGLLAGDIEGRVGTAVLMRRFADHDSGGCKFFITGLVCEA